MPPKKTPKPLKTPPPGMTAQSAPSSSAKPTDTTDKLDQVAAQIQKDQALATAQEQIKAKKEQDIIAGPAAVAQEDAPSLQMTGFVPSPILIKVAGGVTFHIMKRITNMFEKDLRPLSDQQAVQLEAVLARLAEKYIPASMSKYQEGGEIFLVLGGIVFSNITDIEKPRPATTAPAQQKGPTIPATPTANVVVIEAAAPPIPTGVQQ